MKPWYFEGQGPANLEMQGGASGIVLNIVDDGRALSTCLLAPNQVRELRDSLTLLLSCGVVVCEEDTDDE